MDTSKGNGHGASSDGEIRVGVYVCHCGTNIAATVDVAEVVRFAEGLPNVAVAKDYQFMCSEPGQELIQQDITEHKLNRVVVAACSPLMHEPTFRRACAEAGLNPFLFQMANIREQCSWVTTDKPRATEKAKHIVRAAVSRVALHAELQVREVPVNERVLIIGGGIAGIEAALQIADAGKPVILVEREPSIGGRMATFDKTFPTLDCAACILTPKMVSAGQHRNIDIRSYAEVASVSGHVGQFQVSIRRNKRYVDDKKCNGCGLCYQECPAIVSPKSRKVSIEGQPYFVGSYAEGGEARKVTIRQGDRERRKPIKDTPTGDCIFCGKCATACSEVVGAHAIVLRRDESAEAGKQRSLEFNGNCIGCGACVRECPTGALTVTDAQDRQVLHHEMMLGPNKAIRVPTLQAVPNVPFIDEETCIHFRNGGCGHCAEVCPQEAISYDMEEAIEEVEVGSILVATGFDTIDLAPMVQYGWGRYDNVISGLEFEILCHASGSTGGKILKADGTPPKSVAILHCIGSRDEHYHEHCSRVCCMYSLKFAHLVREKVECDVYEFYIDIRAGGKGYEEFYKRLMREDVTFIRGKAAEVTNWPMSPEEEGKLVVKAEDTLLGQIRRAPVDMVILSPALQAREGAQTLAQTLGIGCGGEGFFLERHPKLAPVQTAADGVYVAGACQSPKDIPDSVAQGAAAAANILSLIDKGMFSIEPVVAVIDETLCGGCRTCINMCPYSALSADEERNVAVCESALCKGCGTCVATCPAGAIQQQGYTDAQIRAELEGALGRLAASSAE